MLVLPRMVSSPGVWVAWRLFKCLGIATKEFRPAVKVFITYSNTDLCPEPLPAFYDILKCREQTHCVRQFSLLEITQPPSFSKSPEYTLGLQVFSMLDDIIDAMYFWAPGSENAHALNGTGTRSVAGLGKRH